MQTLIGAIICVGLFTDVYSSTLILPSTKHELNKGYELLTKDVIEDATLSVPELIEKYGYTCLTHTITTTEGYILDIHRIPYGKKGPSENRPAVLLQHGLLAASSDWVIPGPHKGFAYILADAGYDVWMPNVRGTKYSRKHITLDPDNDAKQFWDFSWHEIALNDIPQSIDYILAQTNQTQLYYIGHSQGTTVFYVMCSEKPEYNSKIRAHFSMAPVGYMEHLPSPILKFVAFFQQPLGVLFNLIGQYEFLPKVEIFEIAGQILCQEESIFQVLCTNALFAIAGFNPKQLNETLLPVLLGHSPAGASTKQILHYAQEVRSEKFRQYDYGFFENLKRYGSPTPPKYKLKNVVAPMYLFYSKNDWMSAERDVSRLAHELGNVIGKFLVLDSSFAHFDYVLGIDAPNLVYKRVMGLMKKH